MVKVPPVQYCQLPDGQQISWREWGTGDPLIMLHGWSMSSVVFSEVAVTLGKYYRVLCPDLPGHGQSDALSEVQLSGFAKAVEGFAACQEIASAVLLGWSLGGQVALQIAAAKRFAIKKLLLVATTPRFCQTDGWAHGLPATQIRSLDRNMGRAYEKTMGEFFNLQFADEPLVKARYREIVSFAVRSGHLPPVGQAQDCLEVLGQADLRQVLPSITVPTMVMHGELDKIIPLAAGEYLAKQLPNAQLHTLAAVGHAPFLSCPEEAVAQWLKFLQ